MNWIGQITALLALVGAILFSVWRIVARTMKTAREAERAAIDAETERAKAEAQKRMSDARQSAASIDVAKWLRGEPYQP